MVAIYPDSVCLFCVCAGKCEDQSRTVLILLNSSAN